LIDAECGWPTPGKTIFSHEYTLPCHCVVVSSTAQTPTVIPTTSPTPTQTGLEGRYAGMVSHIAPFHRRQPGMYNRFAQYFQCQVLRRLSQQTMLPNHIPDWLSFRHIIRTSAESIQSVRAADLSNSSLKSYKLFY
jgi:hypothetical protein